MKKKIYLSMLLMFLLSISLITSLGGFVSEPIIDKYSQTAAVLTEAVSFEEYYPLNYQLTLPNSDIIADGETYKAKRILTFPNGINTVADTCELSVPGKYKVEYLTVKNDVSYMVDYSFFTYDNLYEVSSVKGSSQEVEKTFYGKTEQYPDAPEGIVASLTYSNQFIYNKVIDFNGKEKTDDIISLYVTPETIGIADANNIIITFTDYYDADNIVTLTVKKVKAAVDGAAWAEVNSYTTANAVGQTPIGLEMGRSGTNVVTFDGIEYLVHRNDDYGSASTFSIPGTPAYTNDSTSDVSPKHIGKQLLKVSVDYAQKRFYVNGNLVSDLDEQTLYGTSIWEGFSSGKCLMSVKGSNYNASALNFVITDIIDMDKNAAEENILSDTTVPDIVIDKDTLFDAQVGKPFYIPQAKATDDKDGEIIYQSKVYINYGTTSQARVDINQNSFVPVKEGKYIIEYSATDAFGNKALKAVTITAKQRTQDLNIVFGAYETSAKVGETVLVSIPSITNEWGEIKLNITAHSDYETVVIPTQGEKAFEFTPKSLGNYTIKYEYGDYYENNVYEYVLNVKGIGKPVIYDNAALPRFLIKGALYNLPEVYGYDFSSGTAQKTKAETYIQDDNKTSQKVTAAKFVSYAENTCKVIYEINETKKTYEIPVIDTNYGGEKIDLTNFFYSEQYVKTADNNCLTFSSDGLSTDKISFINTVQTFEFYTSFKIPQEANNYSGINIYLTDIEDSSIGLKISLLKSDSGDKINLLLNDKQIYSFDAQFGGDRLYELFYNDLDKTLSIDSSDAFAVTKSLDGGDWEGFSNHLAYLDYQLINANGTAAFSLYKINNQPFNIIKYDIISPEISMTTDRGEREKGTKVTIAPAFAADVLNPNITFNMRVTLPDGSVAVAEDGTVLDDSANPNIAYSLVLDKYGSFEILYTANDTSERETLYSYVYRVADTQPPELLLSQSKKTAKNGETVLIASYKVSDNISDECVVKIFLTKPGGAVMILQGNSFVPESTGTYTVTYYAYDSVGNAVFVSYQISVTEA